MKTNRMVDLADKDVVNSADSPLLTNQKAVFTVQLISRSVIGPSRSSVLNRVKLPNRRYIFIFDIRQPVE